ncbi:hypothetical protein LSH36_1834g00012 [Paralvinella palmiformis]|uniref:Uncharacterized protein n=1 Tax=Paralvinella palmiformis TaxID=53620 RepID=A0AAD9MPX1_9ANNE|nr:hypothetical protein LSH36_1834g00012 [Paralvinella palmiformis]
MFYGVNAIPHLIIINLFWNTVANIEEHTYHHCYQEGGSCGINNITCYNNTVIDIMWSRVGYSEYWMWDGYRRNCSVTDDKCEMEIDEPSRNCSGLSLCYLYTCSESTYQRIDCDGLTATNYMRLNYTCIKASSIYTKDIIGNTDVTLLPGETSTAPGLPKEKQMIIIVFVAVGLTVIVGVMAVLIVARRKNIQSPESTRRSKDMTEPPKDYSDSICMDNLRYATSNGFTSHAVISTLKNSGDFCSFTRNLVDYTGHSRNDTNDNREIKAKLAEHRNIISFGRETANIHHSESVLEKDSTSSYSAFRDHVDDNMKGEKPNPCVESDAEVWLGDVMEQSLHSNKKRFKLMPPVGQTAANYATNWTAVERYVQNKISERNNSYPTYEVAADRSRYTRTNKLPRM